MRKVQQRGRVSKGPAKRSKNGGVPRTRRKQGEKKLQYLAQQWLEETGLAKRLLIFHVPNERIGGIGAIVHFKRMGVLAGVADYLAFLHSGRAAAIELKHGDGPQSTDQEKFQARWERRGNTYFLCRTLEEFQGVVNGLTLFA